jgi:hypothetical protein
MADERRQRIAERMHLLLVRELGEGIDVGRMLAQPLYARDVLLVCEALRGSDLEVLGKQFRYATEAMDDAVSLPPSRWPDSTPTSPPSRWPRGWFRNSRWLRW